MKFIIKPNKINPVQGTLAYCKDEYSFGFSPRPAGAVTSILLDDLELMINLDGKVLFVCGLCPYMQWKEMNSNLETYSPGELYVDLEREVIPGVSNRLNKMQRWGVFVNKNTGWVCVGNHKVMVTAIEFATNSVAVIDGQELKALWLKPDKLPVK